MTQKFFDFKGIDIVSDSVVIFYGITLNTDMGIYTKGTKLTGAQIDFDNGVLELLGGEDCDAVFTAKLELCIVN